MGMQHRRVFFAALLRPRDFTLRAPPVFPKLLGVSTLHNPVTKLGLRVLVYSLHLGQYSAARSEFLSTDMYGLCGVHAAESTYQENLVSRCQVLLSSCHSLRNRRDNTGMGPRARRAFRGCLQLDCSEPS